MRSVYFRMLIAFTFLFSSFCLLKAQNVDLSVESCNVPQEVNAGSSLEIVSTFKNVGTQPISSFTYSWIIEGMKKSMIVTDANIEAGQSETIKHKFNFETPSVDCELTLRVLVSNVNGNTDTNSSNDTLSVNIKVINGYKNRLAVIDHFTSVNCPPCAVFNPVLEKLLHENGNMDKVVYMTIHSNLLGPDLLYNQAVPECSERFNVYQPASFPTVYLGGKMKGSPDKISQADINQDFLMPSYLETNCNYNIVDGVMYVGGTVKNLKELSTNAKIFFAVVETMEFETPPGSNGETFFPNVLRKFIPDGDGLNLQSTENNAISSYKEQYTLNSNTDLEKTTIYMFVQDVTTKEYLAAEKLTYGDIATVGNKCLTDLEKEVKIIINNQRINIYSSDYKPITAKLFNINGQAVAETSGTDFSIPTRNNGIYILMITDGNTQYAKKIIIR